MGCTQSTPVSDECNPDAASEEALNPQEQGSGTHLSKRNVSGAMILPEMAATMGRARGQPYLPSQDPAIEVIPSGMSTFRGISAPLPQTGKDTGKADWDLHQEFFEGLPDERASYSALPRLDGNTQQNMSLFTGQTLNLVAGGCDMSNSAAGPMPFYSRSVSDPSCNDVSRPARASSNGLASADQNLHQTLKLPHPIGRLSRKERASVAPGLSPIEEAENSPKAAGNEGNDFAFPIVDGQANRASVDSTGVISPSDSRPSNTFAAHASAPEASMTRDFQLQLPTAHSDPSELPMAQPRDMLHKVPQGLNMRPPTGKSPRHRPSPLQQQGSVGVQPMRTDPGIPGVQPTRLSFVNNPPDFSNTLSPLRGHAQSNPYAQMNANSDAVVYMQTTQPMMGPGDRYLCMDPMYGRQCYDAHMPEQAIPQSMPTGGMYPNGYQGCYPTPAVAPPCANQVWMHPQQGCVIASVSDGRFVTGSALTSQQLPPQNAYMMQPSRHSSSNLYMAAPRQSSNGGMIPVLVHSDSRTSMSGNSDRRSVHSTPLTTTVLSPTGPAPPRQNQSMTNDGLAPPRRNQSMTNDRHAPPRRNQSMTNGRPNPPAARPLPWEKGKAKTSRDAEGVVLGPEDNFVARVLRGDVEKLNAGLEKLWASATPEQQQQQLQHAMQRRSRSRSTSGLYPAALLQAHQHPSQPLVVGYPVGALSQQQHHGQQF